MEQWGWRVPFVVGLDRLALGVFILRRKIEETADYAAAKASGRALRAVWHYSGNIPAKPFWSSP